MLIEQILTKCLSQMSYYIESNGEALVIDPLREIEPYISRAKKTNSKIKYIFETHLNQMCQHLEKKILQYPQD